MKAANDPEKAMDLGWVWTEWTVKRGGGFNSGDHEASAVRRLEGHIRNRRGVSGLRIVMEVGDEDRA